MDVSWTQILQGHRSRSWQIGWELAGIADSSKTPPLPAEAPTWSRVRTKLSVSRALSLVYCMHTHSLLSSSVWWASFWLVEVWNHTLSLTTTTLYHFSIISFLKYFPGVWIPYTVMFKEQIWLWRRWKRALPITLKVASFLRTPSHYLLLHSPLLFRSCMLWATTTLVHMNTENLPAHCFVP